MPCPLSVSCGFFQSVEPSIALRIKHASAYRYCKGGEHSECAIHELAGSGAAVPADLFPDGTRDSGSTSSNRVVVCDTAIVIDDSPVFVRLAAAVVRNSCPDTTVIEAQSFDEAIPHLDNVGLVVTGFGVGGGKTCHDIHARVRAGTPLVVFSGKPNVTLPPGATLVEKTQGASALGDAVRRCMVAS